MTKSTITREESVQAVFDLKVGYSLGLADIEILKRVARMALAAMDSEPVGEFYEDGPLNWYQISDGDRVPDSRRIPLYRHAQPSLVPDKMTYQDGVLFVLNNDMSSIERGTVAMRAWNACRAAMLQPLHTIKAASALGSLPKTGEVLHTNSPVIPDGSEHCPCCGKKLRRACSVEGCEGKHVAHGLCKKHYDMKRCEDPEQVRKFREAGKRYRRKTKSAAAAPQEVKGE
ncbi:TPA: hypothetical protein ACHS84_002376 [Klebsiella aerogenes]